MARIRTSSAARAFFGSHDVVHVLYGCGTTLCDEAVVKFASLFGTSGGLSLLRGYRLHESREIYRKLPLGGTFVAVLAAPYLLVRTLWRCIRQRRRWPWNPYEEYIDVPLANIRANFGITVAHAGRKSAD